MFHEWWDVSYHLSEPVFNCIFSAGPEEDGLPGPGLLRSLKCQLVALKQLHAWAWFFVAPSAFVKGSGCLDGAQLGLSLRRAQRGKWGVAAPQCACGNLTSTSPYRAFPSAGKCPMPYRTSTQVLGLGS